MQMVDNYVDGVIRWSLVHDREVWSGGLTYRCLMSYAYITFGFHSISIALKILISHCIIRSDTFSAILLHCII